MKIFWSWQSDTPGKIGHHFVRDALSAAIEQLKEKPEIEKPTALEAVRLTPRSRDSDCRSPQKDNDVLLTISLDGVRR